MELCQELRFADASDIATSKCILTLLATCSNNPEHNKYIYGNSKSKVAKKSCQWMVMPAPTGGPTTCRPPPGCSSPRKGHWGGTWAVEGSLADRLLMNDFSSFDELGHVTN